MSEPFDVPPETPHELTLGRILRARRNAVYRAWTEPHLLRRWFAPRPLTVSAAELDVRPGGSSRVVMRTPDGTEFPAEGVYLEVVPDERLVFTDAFRPGWMPSDKPFMTATLLLQDEPGGRTRYTARVRHWSREDREKHEAMGFSAGWGQCADQLEEVAAGL